MSRNGRCKTNARIREYLDTLMQDIQPGQEFTTEEMTDKVREKFTKARIDNRRVGHAIRMRDDVLRIGQVWGYWHGRYGAPTVWQRIKPGATA